jgi:hypothetical protein
MTEQMNQFYLPFQDLPHKLTGTLGLPVPMLRPLDTKTVSDT